MNKKKIIIGTIIAGIVGYFIWRKLRVKPEQKTLRDVFDNLTFETGKSIIKSTSFPYLDELATVLIEDPTWNLKIVGHTDNVGSDQINLRLSKARAEAVKKYLVDKGIAITRIETAGFGETKPIASNTTPDGREKNRRVEFTIIKPNGTDVTVTK
jgi:OOP family OmpA-OmpF porin